jgi:hypothetical protein
MGDLFAVFVDYFSIVAMKTLTKSWMITRDALVDLGSFKINDFNVMDLVFMTIVVFTIPFVLKSVFRVIREISRLWTVIFVLVVQIIFSSFVLFFIFPWTDAIRTSYATKMMENPMTHTVINMARESVNSRLGTRV